MRAPTPLDQLSDHLSDELADRSAQIRPEDRLVVAPRASLEPVSGAPVATPPGLRVPAGGRGVVVRPAPAEPLLPPRPPHDPRRLPSHRARPRTGRRAAMAVAAGLLAAAASGVVAAQPWL